MFSIVQSLCKIANVHPDALWLWPEPGSEKSQLNINSGYHFIKTITQQWPLRWFSSPLLIFSKPQNTQSVDLQLKDTPCNLAFCRT